MPDHSPLDSHPTGQASSEFRLEARADQVWAVLTDVDHMPGIHPRMLRAEWIDGASGPALGACFASHNAHDVLGVWQALSRIVEFMPYRTVAWTIESPVAPAAVCRFDFFPEPGVTGECTVVRQSYFYDSRPGADPPVARALSYIP